MKKGNLEISGFYLQITCGQFPEQYDVFEGEEYVGYVRLRGGHLTVRRMGGSPEPEHAAKWGPFVYERDTGWGEFDSEADRARYLTEGMEALRASIDAGVVAEGDWS